MCKNGWGGSGWEGGRVVGGWWVVGHPTTQPTPPTPPIHVVYWCVVSWKVGGRVGGLSWGLVNVGWWVVGHPTTHSPPFTNHPSTTDACCSMVAGVVDGECVSCLAVGWVVDGGWQVVGHPTPHHPPSTRHRQPDHQITHPPTTHYT